VKIGLFADTHYCEAQTLEQNRKPRRAYEAVKKAFDDFKLNNVEVVICMGDLIHYNDSTEISVEHLKKMAALIHSYSIPCYICLGNHDYEVLNREDYEKISGIKTAPCIIENKNTRLILLDAGYTPDAKKFNQGEVDWTVSYVPEEELKWLDDQLETDKKCAVFIHQNIDVNVEEHHIVSNADEINAVISRHKNVSHVYQGHYHYGAENVINSVLYTTIRAMCIGDENNYKIVEV
jgi:DNA repair exonuclease SbcCD nuclease subunit